ncbi:MAG: glycosyl hydrolase, partial [Acidobacteriota bacterium]
MTHEGKPWVRWWWHGSAVDPASLTRELEGLRDAGIGGVEITPIYGVRGADPAFIPFLSDQWVQMLEHTLREASRLDLGVDMATGTGWPFGGPWVDDASSARTIAHKTWTLDQGERLTEPVRFRQAPLLRAVGSMPAPGSPGGTRPVQIADLIEPVTANPNLQALALDQVRFGRDLPLVVLMARSQAGSAVDVTARVGRDGALDWIAPAGRWTLDALFLGWHGKMVERAAPGGEGPVIDHFSRSAIRGYLARFDRAFSGHSTTGLRAFFNDSYEVDDASGQGDGTPALLEAFQERRGYDLRQYLPALFGRDSEERNGRVLADYRETISDLLLETFTAEWGSWAHGRRALIRNQAHGAPASLLDLYAASDIPETEGEEISRFKWATSAGHVAGRRLISAEAATWLGEHFRSTLADVRADVDRFFVAGVNHIVYHGTAYSPDNEPWPGRQFYAAVEFNPRNAWWDDFSALNRYVGRVQSFLQAGRPDTDVLLYYPLYDQLAVRGSALLTHFGGANEPLTGTTFDKAGALMQRRGFTYDYLSDRQLRSTRIDGGGLRTSGGGQYRVLILPSSTFIPLDTFERVLTLARSGAIVLALDGWPADVAGLGDLETRRRRFQRATDGIRFGPADADGISAARHGKGRILRGGDLERLLTRAGVAREPMVDTSLQFARRIDSGGRRYFISNDTDRTVDGFVPLDVRNGDLTLFDPMHGSRGKALVRRALSGTLEVFLHLPPRESLIVAAGSSTSEPEYPWYRPAGAAATIAGSWTIRFVKGGPTVPPERTVQQLGSWTAFGGEDLKAF